MATIQEIRRINARKLAARAGSDAIFADRVGISPSRVSQLIGKTPVKNIGHTTARRMESALGEEPGWLDVLHDEVAKPSVAGKRTPVKSKTGDAVNDEVGADEIMDLIAAYKNALPKDRKLAVSNLRASAKLAGRKRVKSRGSK